MYNAVVQPITGETITKYKVLAKDPATKKAWQEGMCIGLGKPLQG